MSTKRSEDFIRWHEKATSMRGSTPEAPSAFDLVCWLSAIHVAQLDAGEQLDGEGWEFFADLYMAISI